MKKSKNYDFYLPSRDTDDIADINQISENFEKIDLELSEMIKGKGVDQNYNPLSANPQSGIAIEEALENYLPLDVETEWIFDGGDAANEVAFDFIVDDGMSDNSNNVVANKVIKAYIDKNINDINKDVVNLEEDVVNLEEKLETDYIIEQGTSGIWTYRKWASGIVECWGLTQYSVTPNQAWGDSHFYGTIDEIAFPEGLFVNTPVLTVSVCNENGGFFVSHRDTTTQNTGTIYAITVAESETAIDATFSFSAKGRWKEV